MAAGGVGGCVAMAGGCIEEDPTVAVDSCNDDIAEPPFRDSASSVFWFHGIGLFGLDLDNIIQVRLG